MKIKKPSKKLIILILSTLLVVAVGVTAAWAIQNNNKLAPAISSPSQEDLDKEAQQAADDKQKFLDNEKKNEGNTGTADPVINDTTLLLSANQTDSNLVISTQISGFSGEGLCTLTLSKNGQQDIIKTASILYQPEFSSCAGFSIPLAEVSNGTWNVSLTTTTNGKNYTKSINYTIQ